MPHETTETLRRCPFFARLDEESLGRLADIARTRRFGRGEVIFRQDDPPPGVFVVSQGLVRVYKLASTGKEHVLHLVHPHQTFAEVAVIGDFPCPAFAEAVEETRCVMLPTEPFQKMLAVEPQLCRRLLTGLSHWVRHLVDLLEDIVLRDASGRVARYLLGIAEKQGQSIQLPSLKKHLASHLNLTSETLSRTLRRMDEAGLIESRGGQALTLRDLAGLESLAEGVFPRI